MLHKAELLQEFNLTMQILVAGGPESERKLKLGDLGLGIRQNGSQ